MLKGMLLSKALTCVKKFPVGTNMAILSSRRIPLAILLYEQCIHLTQITLPNIPFLSTQQRANRSLLVTSWFDTVCITVTR